MLLIIIKMILVIFLRKIVKLVGQNLVDSSQVNLEVVG